MRIRWRAFGGMHSVAFEMGADQPFQAFTVPLNDNGNDNKQRKKHEMKET